MTRRGQVGPNVSQRESRDGLQNQERPIPVNILIETSGTGIPGEIHLTKAIVEASDSKL